MMNGTEQFLIQLEIESLLGLSLRIPANPSPDIFTQKHGSHTASSSFEELVQGIIFSRKFILTYHVVILSILLALTVLHWGDILLSRWRRRGSSIKHVNGRILTSRDLASDKKDKHDLQDYGGRMQSFNSIFHGTCTSYSSKAPSSWFLHGEQSPLLPKPHYATNTSRRTSVVLQIKSWLIYQPRPIAFPNTVFPSNLTTLCLLILITIQIFYLLYGVKISVSNLFVLADRAGLVFVANLPLLYLLAAKNQPIKLLTGYSYESLNIFHRRLGEFLCLFAVIHSLGMIGVWYTLLYPRGLTLASYLLKKIILLGLGAFVTYEILFFTSLRTFRQMWYELFLVMHVVLQTAGLILLWFHHHGSRPYVGAALAIYFVDRCVYRMVVKTKTVKATVDIKQDRSTVGLKATLPNLAKRQTWRAIFGMNITYGWKVTDHVFLAVPSLSSKHILQAHPFSIASKVPTSDDTRLQLELIIRAQAGFSRDLLNYAQRHNLVDIRLDGPYGSSSALNMLQASDIRVLVAGGSGIAVIWPLVSALLDANDQNPESLPTIDQPSNIFFVWVVRHSTHLSWLASGWLEALQAKGVKVVVPPPTAENGHPPLHEIITTHISREDGNFEPRLAKIGIVSSGPEAMNRAVRNTCSSALLQGLDASIQVEKYGW